MRSKILAILVVLATLNPGCAPPVPRFDATNETTIRTSTQALVDGLGPEDKKSLLAKILRKTLRGTRDPGAGPKTLHGLTAQEILAAQD